jgi:Glycosyl transferase family 2
MSEYEPRLGARESDESAIEPRFIGDTIEVSVVMPCLNEADTLAVCIRKHNGHSGSIGSINGEIVIADNGSTDGSQAIAHMALPEVTALGVTFDAHKLLVCSLFILLGYESIVFTIFAQTFAIGEDLLPQNRRLDYKRQFPW